MEKINKKDMNREAKQGKLARIAREREDRHRVAEKYEVVDTGWIEKIKREKPEKVTVTWTTS